MDGLWTSCHDKTRKSCWRGARAAESDSLLTRASTSRASLAFHPMRSHLGLRLPLRTQASTRLWTGVSVERSPSKDGRGRPRTNSLANPELRSKLIREPLQWLVAPFGQAAVGILRTLEAHLHCPGGKNGIRQPNSAGLVAAAL